MVYMKNLGITKSKMETNKITRTTFDFSINKKPFSCIFMVDTTPFRLYLTTLGDEPYVIELEVLSDFAVKSILDNKDYVALVRYLGLKYDPNDKFSPTKFLNEVNAILPTVEINSPQYTYVLRMVSQKRKVEEPDKIYFKGWKKLPDGQNVSPQNKEKTLAVFGEEMAELCARSKISSCWTDQINLSAPLDAPSF